MPPAHAAARLHSSGVLHPPHMTGLRPTGNDRQSGGGPRAHAARQVDSVEARATTPAVTAAERPPDRHTTTIRRSRGNSSCRARTRPVGSSIAPGACPADHSWALAHQAAMPPPSTILCVSRGPSCGVSAKMSPSPPHHQARPASSARRQILPAHPTRRQSPTLEARSRPRVIRSRLRSRATPGAVGSRPPIESVKAGSGISRALVMVPSAVSRGSRTSTSCRPGCEPRHSVSSSAVNRGAVSTRSDRCAKTLPRRAIDQRPGRIPRDTGGFWILTASAVSPTRTCHGLAKRSMAGGFGEAPLQTDVDRAAQMPATHSRPVSGCPAASPRAWTCRHTSSMSSKGGGLSVEQRAQHAIAERVELEVARSRGLASVIVATNRQRWRL